ncbi:copper chaperone PCu(A)C [Rhodomicrobium sp. Az07]|uniref:copper chaperone PCu(A)C n=1 Tax=Rhodomicrobium sp. Az07 TaxID=2839034 RepID=UPI001BEC8DE1|nr:copper chaperone PCu(A)C [Rhodomicrobium sp. Az07]MBT3070905.1 copper chaperone PCu(A)C [Rhodomicrobium sp. Az07]
MKKYLLVAATGFALSGIAAASETSYLQNGISIVQPWARPTAESAKAGAVYLSLGNKGQTADTLISAATPVAEKTEIHEHVEENGVLKMRAVQGGVKLAPGASAEFKPGGLHVMLLGLKQRLEEGTSFPLTLVFDKAGPFPIEVTVQRAPSAAGASGSHGTQRSGDHKSH